MIKKGGGNPPRPGLNVAEGIELNTALVWHLSNRNRKLTFPAPSHTRLLERKTRWPTRNYAGPLQMLIFIHSIHVSSPYVYQNCKLNLPSGKKIEPISRYHSICLTRLKIVMTVWYVSDVSATSINNFQKCAWLRLSCSLAKESLQWADYRKESVCIRKRALSSLCPL